MEIEKLNNLAILSIEKGMVPKLEYTSFNNDVESQKTRTKIRIMLSMLFVELESHLRNYCLGSQVT